MIDVRHLGTPGEEAEFLAAEVRRRLQQNPGTGDERSAPPQPVLIFLSAPTMLGSGKPFSLGEVHEGNVYLIRYHPSVAMQEMRDGGSGSGSGVDTMSVYDAAIGRPGRSTGLPMPSAPQGSLGDEKVVSLPEVLKPLKPRIFDVASPSQFRETLATLLEELSKM